MGLRERKKKDTREAILAEARKLFLEKGYRSTSVEMIAEASNVAVGTIYNYFNSKAEVMVELNSGETGIAISGIEELDLENTSVEDILWEVVSQMLSALEGYPRELIRELIAATMDNNRSSLASGLARQDERFLQCLSGIIGRLREAGKVKTETDSDTVAFGIYSLVFGGIFWYTFDERTTMDDTKALIAGMIGQFCRGILPEGEGK